MRISKTRQVVVAKASGALIATTNGTAFPTGTDDTLDVFIDATAVTGTGPSMTVSVEWSNDNSTWYVGDTPDTFTAITAAKKVVKEFAVKGQYARLVYTITGTTPSFTFAASALIGD